MLTSFHGLRALPNGQAKLFLILSGQTHSRDFRHHTYVNIRAWNKPVCPEEWLKRVHRLKGPSQHSPLCPDTWTSSGASGCWGLQRKAGSATPTAPLLIYISSTSCGLNWVLSKVSTSYWPGSHGLHGEVVTASQTWARAGWMLPEKRAQIQIQHAHFGLNQTHKGEVRRALQNPRSTWP